MILPFPIAEPESDAAAELGRKLFAGPVDFLKGVVAMDGLPDADRVEVCFAGRSNVGKSSLINALTNRKGLARASNTPGRTQEINFFELGEARYLVDLPGYGYANAPLAVVEKWQRLLKNYLSGRPNLRRAFVLVDSRHGIKEVDRTMMTMLDQAAVGYRIVLTKTDKVKKMALSLNLALLKKELSQTWDELPLIFESSAEKGTGRKEILQFIDDTNQKIKSE